ncbi:hypothetical protein DACRYDRAFT_24917 [Dacryopinax primogenitus]|uniref:Eukaryotic peptide chain release factor GTP-binding subunit n=1 Tax=Dacryopinax primogenitus (strain DJM 731) TaxID=1858805 RepID=M5FQ29_DACPD|nr:uncharacterized protein DACRYDRAFT_24917 [Dacryopinax primogenitus]EJT97498.1 hypothetical protein DACRYDRAFT_24917 [Dacryopinax primogenitus]
MSRNYLNPGANSFVPGQFGRPQQQPPQQQGGQQGQQQPNNQQNGFSQQHGQFYQQQAPYQQYQGYQPQYESYYNQYQQQYYPGQYQAPYAPQQQRYAPVEPVQAAPPQERSAVVENPLPPKTISLSIGKKPAAPVERSTSDDPPKPPPTIKLNIGGSSTTAVKPSAPASQLENLAPTQKAAATARPPASCGTPAEPTAVPGGKPTPVASASQSRSDTPALAAVAASASKAKSKDFDFSLDRAKTNADAIEKEHNELADEETLRDLYGKKETEVVDDGKEHLNIVFIGHVDAGKSTMGGQILYLSGMVDKRTLEKYEREAKEAGRDTWYLSWALDSTPQERAKGKTVEVGRAYFETNARRYTILDAPGHKTFVPSMISGAAQADVALLVISARRGEFETGFERGGQTREHVMLVKTAGVNRVIVVINKMDEPTVEWSKERYDEIQTKLIPFIRSAGFNPKTDTTFIPVSGYTGQNIKERLDKKIASWWDGPSLLELLDTMPMPDRKVNGPVMMPISEKYNSMGPIVVGKIESGRMRKGDSLLLMPNKTPVEVSAIMDETEEEVDKAISGDNVRIRLRGVDDEDISPGFVLTSPSKPVHAVTQFEAQLAILDHKNIICAGYSAVMHVHTLTEEVTLAALLHYFDKKTGRKSKKPPQFAKKGQRIIALVETTAPVCVERFDHYAQLGRFTLRDEGKTIAIGKITRLIESTEQLPDVGGLSLGASSSAA